MATLTSVLSPLDQLMPRSYIRVFLLFPIRTPDHDAAIHSLRTSLQQTLTDLPYLQGTVSLSPAGDGRLSIAWPEYAAAAADPSAAARLLRELPAPAGLPSLAALRGARAPLHHFAPPLAPVGALPDHSAGADPAAAFAASCTRLRGGLVLCVCVHHALMDGTGVGELLRLWARNAREPGEHENHWLRPWANEPLVRREFLRLACEPARPAVEALGYAELLRRHPEYSLKADGPAAAASSGTPNFSSKIFAFPIGKINAAKDELRRFPGLESLTANNILSAILWSCITCVRAKRLAPKWGQRVKLGFAVNGRKHLGKNFVDIPYLGNVNLFGLASLSVSELFSAAKCTVGGSQEQSLEHLIPVIASISGAIARVSVPHIAEAVTLVDKTADVTDVIPGWVSKDALDLSMTSWANLPLYNYSFGDAVGKPEFVRTPFAAFDGLVTILPRRREDGDKEMIDVVIFLRADDIDALESYEPWAWWTS